MKELIVTTKNQVGSLATVAEALGGVGVNIEAISCYGFGEKAIFRIITGDSTTAVKTLSRIPEVKIQESDVIIVKLMNRPGELGKITRKLSNQGVNLESLYILSRKNEHTEVALRPAQPGDYAKARDVLGIKE
jgi:hypothetical protein